MNIFAVYEREADAAVIWTALARLFTEIVNVNCQADRVLASVLSECQNKLKLWYVVKLYMFYMCSKFYCYSSVAEDFLAPYMYYTHTWRGAPV